MPHHGIAGMNILRPEIETDPLPTRWYRVKIAERQASGMHLLPADIPLNCPYCGAKLVNVPSVTAVAFYECPKDGLLVLPPHGRMRKAEPK